MGPGPFRQPLAERFVEDEHDAGFVIVIALGVGVALQHHFFTSPNWRVAGLVAVVGVWALYGTGARVPHPVLGVVVLAGSLTLLLPHPQDSDLAPFFLVFLAGHVATEDSFPLSVVVAGAAAAVPFSFELRGYHGMYVWDFAIVMGWLFGLILKSQRSLLDRLRTAQAGLADKVAAEERQRIASEVHDVIAHSMSVTMLHLTGARLALQTGDYDESQEALEEAERQGRQALADIRRTVGLLAPGSGDGVDRSLPSAADIPTLVSEFANAGLDVQYQGTGDTASLSLATGLGLYRIAQESLANVVRHAPGEQTRVCLEIGSETARLHLVNTLPAAVGIDCSNGKGHGLRGMRQRAELLGGTFRAGAMDGGWSVEAVVPAEPT